MKAITHKLKTLILLLVIFSASNAFGQNTLYYAFIPNGSGEIDRDGFDIGYHSIYSEWDLNKNGEIIESEFYTVIFQRLDSNRNGSLSPKEWIPAQKYLFGQFSGFDQVDKNDDDIVTPEEFGSGMRNTGLFRRYDSDESGNLTRKELNSGVFNSMDLDGNGIIQRNEFSTVRDLYIN